MPYDNHINTPPMQNHRKLIATKSVCFVFISLFVFSLSCQKENSSSCEANHTGYIKVTNNTGRKLSVLVDWEGNLYYDPISLASGTSHTFNDIPVGAIRIGGSYNEYDWKYYQTSASQCQTISYAWTLSSMNGN